MYSKVSELISSITGAWDEQLLCDLFSPVDVQRILQIPINNHGFDDFIAWHFSKNGKYSVRPGYHIQWKSKFGANSSQLALPGGSAINPVWKTIWQLKIPSKVKIFIWRSLHGIVPLKCILANRHIGTSAECPICHNGPEDLRHLLFICPSAQELWHELGIFQCIQEASNIDLSSSAVLEYLLRLPDNSLTG